MKKTLALLILTISVYNGFSQTLNYGIGAGLNYSSLVLSDLKGDAPKYKLGFQINAVIDFSVNNTFGLQIEPGFANRGTILSHIGQTDIKVNINYISVPILFKYSPKDKFSFLVGPELSYRLTAQSTQDGKTIDSKLIYDSKIDFGINAGLSYSLIDKFKIGLKYNRGFISTVKDLIFVDKFGQDGKGKLCNQGFTVFLTFMLR
jgi:opacity protein-like surface antigen